MPCVREARTGAPLRRPQYKQLRGNQPQGTKHLCATRAPDRAHAHPTDGTC